MIAAAWLAGATLAAGQTAGLGPFTDHGDVGNAARAGSAEYDSAKRTFLVTGGGANMWAGADAFHYVWKQMSNDVAITSDIEFLGTSAEAHRKACLVIRQTLDDDSPYVDVAVHGNGLTSIQYREVKGGVTHEIKGSLTMPKRVRIEKRGKYASMSFAAAGEALHLSGGTVRIEFTEPFYVGLAVCAHNNSNIEMAVFSNVEITPLQPPTGEPVKTECSLQVISMRDRDRQVVYHTADHIEAPNWSRDGKYFLFNSNGHIYKLPVTGGKPELLDTGAAVRCNNDHGISPDGTLFAISDQSQGGGASVYVLPIAGGTPKRITKATPSYWHGWSPDGKTLAFCGERNHEFDVYTIPVEGGGETRLTTAPGLDDGPEYSPDGKYIYFNSVRSGLMQIWRMKPDGSGQEQVTFDDYNNWFAHPSPDGRWIVFLSFPKEVTGHPANKDVTLRMRAVAGGDIVALGKFFGGQGTINVPSWSPDSQQVAFVSYDPVYP